jgi:predicted AAA+ superfamily ATPase
MIKRGFHERLAYLLSRFPGVTVLGPRQCGKTTFIREALSGWTYLDLERRSDATPLEADAEARLMMLGDSVIFDEAQRVPQLFPVLRGVIDRERSRNGRFVLLGSASPALVKQISESLAGRTAFLDLPPFRWDEVARGPRDVKLPDLWFRGGFPDALLEQHDVARLDWFEAYTRAFIERDLPGLGIDVSATQMRRLWAMVAHGNGSLWNASQLAASLWISYHTVNRYLDILEQTFLVRRLAPYFVDIAKRMVKSPKIYFLDTGLLHYISGNRIAAETGCSSFARDELGGVRYRPVDFSVSACRSGESVLFLENRARTAPRACGVACGISSLSALGWCIRANNPTPLEKALMRCRPWLRSHQLAVLDGRQSPMRSRAAPPAVTMATL